MPELSEDTVDEYVKFVDSVISANIPEEKCQLKNLVKKYQVHHHSKTCKKYHARECRFNFGQFFSKKQSLQNLFLKKCRLLKGQILLVAVKKF